jgi:PrtD family type I secretion system ABC transporter
MKKNANILNRAVQNCTGKFTVIIFFSLFINILMFVAPLHMLQIYDRVLVSRSEVTLIALTSLAVGLLMVYGLLEGVRLRILNRMSLEFDELMNDRMLDMVFDISVRRPSLRAQQIIRDSDMLRDFVGGQAIIALCDSPWVPVFITVCFILHPLLGFVALSGAVIVFLLAACNEWLTRGKIFQANRLWVKIANESAVSIRNSEIIKVLGMVPGIKQTWTQNRNQALNHQTTANDRGSAVLASSRFVRMALQVIILATGGYLAIQDQISPGTMIAASIIMGRALAPVEMAVGQWKNFVNVRDAYNRLNEALEWQPEEHEYMDLPAPIGNVSLNSVFLAAPEQPNTNIILNNISLNFEPGTVTGIVGPSGCGKSSLVRAIVGVWGVLRGSVRYDGADIASWNSDKLGPYIGYMPQDIEILDGTVAQNIGRFQEVDPKEIIRAARKAGVHELILKLPNGYDTKIGADGQALSGGQRQRIALARALYMDPKVIVLDEPNSNLDSDGEKALADAIIESKKAGATIIVVSHRPALLRSTDKLAVLHQGKLVKMGETNQVLNELGAGNMTAGMG